MSPVDRYGDEVEGGAQREKRSHGSNRSGPSTPRWETVPKGTAPSICTGHRKPGGSCRSEVFWIERAKIRKGKPVPGATVRVPVNCDVPGGQRPDSMQEGKGLTHYADCPDAEQF